MQLHIFQLISFAKQVQTFKRIHHRHSPLSLQVNISIDFSRIYANQQIISVIISMKDYMLKIKKKLGVPFSHQRSNWNVEFYRLK